MNHTRACKLSNSWKAFKSLGRPDCGHGDTIRATPSCGMPYRSTDPNIQELIGWHLIGLQKWSCNTSSISTWMSTESSRKTLKFAKFLLKVCKGDDLPKLFRDKRHEGVKQSQHGFKHVRKNCLSPWQGCWILVLVQSSFTGLNVPKHKPRLYQPLARRWKERTTKISPIQGPFLDAFGLDAHVSKILNRIRKTLHKQTQPQWM